MDSTHPLDNVIWSALTSEHRAYAEGNDAARRYASAFAPFVSVPDFSKPDYAAMLALLPVGQDVALFTLADIAPPEAFEVTTRRDMLQMIASAAGPAPKPRRDAASGDRSFAVLGTADVPDMLALVDRTKPGPFSARTHELGNFLGIRVDGRLVAMVGERMRLAGHTEVSAVCCDPDFRGRGLARELLLAVSRGIVERGGVPFLHVFADNLSAVALYRQCGFAVRSPIRLTVMHRRAAD